MNHDSESSFDDEELPFDADEEFSDDFEGDDEEYDDDEEFEDDEESTGDEYADDDDFEMQSGSSDPSVLGLQSDHDGSELGMDGSGSVEEFDLGEDGELDDIGDDDDEESISYDSEEERDYMEELAMRFLPQETVKRASALTKLIVLTEHRLQREKQRLNRRKAEVTKAQEAVDAARNVNGSDEDGTAGSAPELENPPSEEEIAALQHKLELAKDALDHRELNITVREKCRLVAWRELAELLRSVHRSTSDKYAQTLDYHDRQSVEHLSRMVRTQRMADAAESVLMFDDPETEIYKIVAYTSYLISEATRMDVDQLYNIHEIVPSLLNESSRAKRIVPMSLLYSLLDSDPNQLQDAVAQGLHVVLFRRLQAILPEQAAVAMQEKRGAYGTQSPQRSAISSPLLKIAPDPESPAQNGGDRADRKRKRVLEWIPQINECVVPGPDMISAPDESTDGIKTAFDVLNHAVCGRVVGVTEGSVIVQWVDQQALEVVAPREQRRRRVQGNVPYAATRNALWPEGYRPNAPTHRYRFDGPQEVIPLETALEYDPLSGLDLSFKKEELLTSLALIGALAGAKDVILPAVQFGIIPGLIKLLGTGAIEYTSRALWALQSLLLHRRLAVEFIANDGLSVLLKLATDPPFMSQQYGCGLIMAQLAKPSSFEGVLALNSSDAWTEMVQISRQNLATGNTEVKGAGCGFFYGSCSFPVVLQRFDSLRGPEALLDMLRHAVKRSLETTDLVDPPLILAALKPLQVWIQTHLMVASRVLFRKHRQLFKMLDKPADRALPRDLRTWDYVMTLLSTSLSDLTDGVNSSTDPAWTTLTEDKLKPLHAMKEAGLHQVLLELCLLFLKHLRFDLLHAALHILSKFAHAPFVRPAIANCVVNTGEGAAPQTGIKALLSVVSSLDRQKVDSIASVTSSLETLVLVLELPSSPSDGERIAFENACSAIRSADGIRTILSLLMDGSLPKRDSPQSEAETNQMYPAASLAIRAMFLLRNFSDTQQLFNDMTVKRSLTDIARHFKASNQLANDMHEAAQAQRETQEGEKDGHHHHHHHQQQQHQRAMYQHRPPVWQLKFMEHISTLLGSTGQASLQKVIADPFETMERQAVVSRAHIDYQKESLLSLIADHLENEGLGRVADTLRQDAQLPPKAMELPPATPIPVQQTPTSAGPSGAARFPQAAEPTSVPTTHSLDGMVRNYLKHQHEQCAAPIAALPPFDLQREHQYRPTPAVGIELPYKNVVDRLMLRKAYTHCDSEALRLARVATLHRHHVHHRLVFDIRGGADGIAANCISFAQNGSVLLVGTSEGGLALFDTGSDIVSNDKLIGQHIVFEDDQCSDVTTSHCQRFVGAISNRGHMKVLNASSMPAVLQTDEDCGAVDFSRDGSHFLTTCFRTARKVSRKDMATGTSMAEYFDSDWAATENCRNVGQFDSTGNLVLSDAVLWDVRLPSDRPIHRFDRISEEFRSSFHPSYQMVIVDENVWDLRQRRLLQTVPQLMNAIPKYTDNDRILYSWKVNETFGQLSRAGNTVNVLDAGSFETLTTLSFKMRMTSFDTDVNGTHLAGLYESDSDSAVRVYGIGVDNGLKYLQVGREGDIGELDGNDERDESQDSLSVDSFTDEDEGDFSHDDEDWLSDGEEDEEGDFDDEDYDEEDEDEPDFEEIDL